MTENLQRAYLYDSFATLFAHEHGVQTLFLLTDKTPATSFLQAMDCIAPKAAKRLQQALSKIAMLSEQEAALELRADFTHAFLLNPTACAAPYASAWLSTDENEKHWRNAHEREVQQWLQQHQLSIATDFREPADHLAILLAAAAMLARDQADIAIQHDFLSNMLLSWLPAFYQRCEQIELRFDFYPALSNLLLAFIKIDIHFLSHSNEDENIL